MNLDKYIHSYNHHQDYLKRFPLGGGIKMAAQEDYEFTSSHEQIRTTTTYRKTISENELKTNRRDFIQLRI